VVNRNNCRILGLEPPYTFLEYEGISTKIECMVCSFLSWGDWAPLLSREDREQHKLPRIARIICSPTNETHSTQHFLSTRWCPSALGPDSETGPELNFSKRMDCTRRSNTWALSLPWYNPMGFFFWSYIPSKSWYLFELGAVASVTPQMLGNAWRGIEHSSDVLRATNDAHVKMHWIRWVVPSSEKNKFSVSRAISVLCAL
jgi:hypothetical protein